MVLQLLAISKFKAILEPYFEIPFSDYSILKEIIVALGFDFENIQTILKP